MTITFPAEVELGNDLKIFQLTFQVCENPQCECNGVNLKVYNENKEVPFFLDFATESYKEAYYSQEDIKIIKSLIDFLKSSKTKVNLAFFKDNYAYVKKMVKNRRDALKSFRPGVLLLYRDIMWKDEDIKISIDGKNYLIFDSYCVTPNCACKDTGLYFFEDNSDFTKPDFSFIYDYEAKDYREPINIDKAEIIEILNIIPDVFEDRHKILKENVKRDAEIKMKKYKLKPVKMRKLGRNDTCHCGSGKKYKKCCLNKDVDKCRKMI